MLLLFAGHIHCVLSVSQSEWVSSGQRYYSIPDKYLSPFLRYHCRSVGAQLRIRRLDTLSAESCSHTSCSLSPCFDDRDNNLSPPPPLLALSHHHHHRLTLQSRDLYCVVTNKPHPPINDRSIDATRYNNNNNTYSHLQTIDRHVHKNERTSRLM